MLKKLLLPLLCALFLLPSAQALEGMDISVFQGRADLAVARQAGIEVVYIRASYGLRGVDSRFAQNCAAARSAGLPFGLYHYLNANDPDTARREAEHFVSLLRTQSYTCRPVLDFEGRRALSKSQATAVALAFLERVEELTGQRPMIYADHTTASTQLGNALAAYPLWLAQWGISSPSLRGTPWSTWTGWQYTNRGLVSGVAGYVDRDRFTEGVFLQAEEPTFSYTVRPGDTLWALSRRFHTTVDALAALNHIPDPDLIYVNQSLRIPGTASAVKTYTVQPGDTLWGIARHYGVTVNQIVQLNNIPDPNLIYPGQVFHLP